MAPQKVFDIQLKTIRANLPVKIPVYRKGAFVCEVTLQSFYDYPHHLQYYIFHTMEHDEQYLLYKNVVYANIYDDSKIDFDGECSLDDAYDRARGKSEPLLTIYCWMRMAC